MIDPLILLAFSVYANKGAYALLVGSGVSRASGIPTGWEVVLDLIRKVAKLEGEDCEPDPAAWFKKKHVADPDYSKLLDVIAKTPTERQSLLRGYFEPSDEERIKGLKAPSPAHKAIARLVAVGFLRVIITTNFDRLLERALEEAGVTATVISTPDQITGAVPLAHSGVTLIKLHGDYLDTRIKNTESELATYETGLNSLLDRVVDEYGLIICGWSADWDLALRSAIERCPSRRFTTYWATRSNLVGQAKRLADHRKAEILQIRDANQLFEGLLSKVQALADMAAPHPLSAKMAMATVKRYIVDPSAKIRLRDLVYEESEKLFAALSNGAFSAQAQLQPIEEVPNRAAKYEVLCETLLSIMIVGCYWGDEKHQKLWVDSLERIGNAPDFGGGLVYLLKMGRYPALLLLYAGGLAAIASGNYQTLAALLIQPKVKDERGQNVPICSEVHSISVIEPDIANLLYGTNRRQTPLSDHLWEKLRAPFREYIPRDEDFEDIFDRFEYLLGLVHADINRWEFAENCWWGPAGRFRWRGRRFSAGGIMKKIGEEIEAEATNWPPLKAGLFGGSLEQAKEARTKFETFLGHFGR